MARRVAVRGSLIGPFSRGRVLVGVGHGLSYADRLVMIGLCHALNADGAVNSLCKKMQEDDESAQYEVLKIVRDLQIVRSRSRV